jgi:hypothetical protein
MTETEMSKADAAYFEAVKRDVAEMIKHGDKILTLACYVRGGTRTASAETARVAAAAIIEVLAEAAPTGVR